MSKVMVVIAAVLAFSCSSVSSALAEAPGDCAQGTQGAWARIIAGGLAGLEADSDVEAAASLSAVGIAPPEPGWQLTACIDEDIKRHLFEDRDAAVAAGRVTRSAQGGGDDQQQDVSPSKPN